MSILDPEIENGWTRTRAEIEAELRDLDEREAVLRLNQLAINLDGRGTAQDRAVQDALRERIGNPWSVLEI